MSLGRKKVVSTHAGQNSKPFSYVAISATGERHKGTMVAPTHSAVVTALQREGWVPVEVNEASSSALNVDLTAFLTGGGVKFKWSQRAEFARRLHQMLRAGISAHKALTALADGAPAQVAEMFTQMAEEVRSGSSLSESMGKHPRAFDKVTISYIAAGEESGTLVETSGRLAEMLAKRAALQAKIKGVSAYPKMVGGAISLLVVGIIMFLVPMYADIYKSFGAKLPAPTLALMWLADHFSPFGIKHVELGPLPLFLPVPYPWNIGSVLLYLVIGIVIFRRKTADNLEIGRRIEKIAYRLPLTGDLQHKQSLQRWASTLAGAIASGVPSQKAVTLAADASGSRWQQWLAPHIIEAVRTGRTIADEVATVPELYPPNVRTMIATGSETGEIDTMLNSVAEALDSDIDAIVAGLSAKIEVALLLVLGAVVGGLLMVLYMPILQLATTASKGLGG